MPSRKIFAFLVLLILLTGCSKLALPSSGNDTQKMAAKITLTPSKAAMVGRVETTYTGKRTPLGKTVVRLARVFWNEDKSDGAFVLEGATSPSNISTEDGFFVFSNIDPADYVVVVGEVIGYNEIIKEPDGKAKVYTVQAGQTLDIGTLVVQLSPP